MLRKTKIYNYIKIKKLRVVNKTDYKIYLY